MSLPAVTWADAYRYFNRRNTEYEIYPQGGDIIILRKSDRITVCIGHKFHQKQTEKLRPGHLSSIKRHFGVSIDDILGG